MNTTTGDNKMLTEDITAAIEKAMARINRIPLDVDLWGIKEVSAYLKRAPAVVRERIVPLPTFPRPIRLPTAGNGRAKLLYKAQEVIDWAEQHQEKRRRA